MPPSPNEGSSTPMPPLVHTTPCICWSARSSPIRPERASTTLCYVVIWDSVSFHRVALVHDRFIDNLRSSNIFLPSYSTFLNPIEEFFSAQWWKVYDRDPYIHVNFPPGHCEACQGWIRHTRGFSPTPGLSYNCL